MNKQVEITEETPLLTKEGLVNAPGYCKRNLFVYDRELARPKWRRKEWEFYQIYNENYFLQLLFANISIGAFGTATYVDMKTGKRYTNTSIAVGTRNRFVPPANGDRPYRFSYNHGKVSMTFDVRETERILTFDTVAEGQPFRGEILLSVLPGQESITIATPFKKPGRFFLTQKLNCMPVGGYFEVGGRKIEPDPQNTFAVLDWGRGVWPYKNTWYWGNGSQYIDGKLFGFEITWGFGDEENATETALFYDGKCHKIGRVDVEKNPKGNWMEPWVFHSEDGRFEMTMTPMFDNVTGKIVLGLLGANCHQVFGKWNGKVVLDDGKVLEIKDMFAACEREENCW